MACPCVLQLDHDVSLSWFLWFLGAFSVPSVRDEDDVAS